MPGVLPWIESRIALLVLLSIVMFRCTRHDALFGDNSPPRSPFYHTDIYMHVSLTPHQHTRHQFDSIGRSMPSEKPTTRPGTTNVPFPRHFQPAPLTNTQPHTLPLYIMTFFQALPVKQHCHAGGSTRFIAPQKATFAPPAALPRYNPAGFNISRYYRGLCGGHPGQPSLSRPKIWPTQPAATLAQTRAGSSLAACTRYC